MPLREHHSTAGLRSTGRAQQQENRNEREHSTGPPARHAVTFPSVCAVRLAAKARLRARATPGSVRANILRRAGGGIRAAPARGESVRHGTMGCCGARLTAPCHTHTTSSNTKG